MTRPDYSPREMRLLREQDFAGTSWVTTEKEPRKVEMLGCAMVDQDVYVVRIEGDKNCKWLMACGNNGWDGNIVGDEGLWVREA